MHLGAAPQARCVMTNGLYPPHRDEVFAGRWVDSSDERSLAVGPRTGTTRLSMHRLAHAAGRGGFTLIDILVSIAIIAVLIGILLPSLAMVRSSTEKVVCASNIRQAGLGLHMFAMDNNDYLPQSTYSLGGGEQWNTTPLQLRFEVGNRGDESLDSHYWDGLGFLIGQNYLSDGQIFYCPSHLGENTYENFLPQFNGGDGDIIANYQYRGIGPNGEQRLDQFVSTVALVSDGFRDLDEINHPNGMNVLRASMGVSWFRDANLTAISNAILGSAGDEDGWQNRWDLLDEPQRPGGWAFFD